jgi:hypothetical protein
MSEEAKDATKTKPPENSAVSGASFDTPQGRAAQGMKPDIGGSDDREKQKQEEDEEEDRKKTTPEQARNQPKKPVDGA